MADDEAEEQPELVILDLSGLGDPMVGVTALEDTMQILNIIYPNTMIHWSAKHGMWCIHWDKEGEGETHGCKRPTIFQCVQHVWDDHTSDEELRQATEQHEREMERRAAGHNRQN